MSISPIENCPAATAYLERIGARMRTLFGAVVQTKEFGYDKDVGRIRFHRDGSVWAEREYGPTKEEADAIKLEVSSISFPSQIGVKALSSANIPPQMRDAQSKDLFIYENKEGEIVFVQVRKELDNGDKKYLPFTYWSDSQWRSLEPEQGLPFYNLRAAKKGDRVFLHEGAKAAKAAIEICDDPQHPWSEYFRTGVHVGWIGGVHHVRRTNWRDLRGVPGELIIVADNDFVGRMKISEIAGRFECPTFGVRFDASFPRSWDVADPIPEAMYSNEKQEDGSVLKTYNGPAFEELMYACDWATEEIEFPPEEAPNRPQYRIREQFAQNWVRIQNIQHYAHLSSPDKTMNKDQFNSLVRPFSDVEDTARLLGKVSGNMAEKVTFRPDLASGLIYVDGDYCLNQYIDHRIKPQAHDGEATRPFWRFLDYLFPNEQERHWVTRWMATLYARPQTRMGFGLLLLSKLQGVGKSTLLNIMADLVGKKHSSFPGDSMIQSDFNGWLVNKRLVVVHEIYAGQNWKTYNRLKSQMTEGVIEANNKHVANYQLPNWSHYAAASNSLEALRVENDDRRWYVPLLPDQLYPHYQELYDWLKFKGLRFLAHDLLHRNDYLTEGDKAPSTAAKEALIDQSMPTDERMALTCAERLNDGDCMDTKEMWLWLQQEANLRAFVSPQRISSLMREKGFYVEDAKVGGRPRILVWRSLQEFNRIMNNLSDSEAERLRAERMKMPSEVFRDNKVM